MLVVVPLEMALCCRRVEWELAENERRNLLVTLQFSFWQSMETVGVRVTSMTRMMPRGVGPLFRVLSATLWDSSIPVVVGIRYFCIFGPHRVSAPGANEPFIGGILECLVGQSQLSHHPIVPPSPRKYPYGAPYYLTTY